MTRTITEINIHCAATKPGWMAAATDAFEIHFTPDQDQALLFLPWPLGERALLALAGLAMSMVVSLLSSSRRWPQVVESSTLPEPLDSRPHANTEGVR